jgi:hypothetical protein
MESKRSLLQLFTCSLLWSVTASVSAEPVTPATTDPRAIVRASVDRPTGDKASSTVSLTVHDSLGRERVRAMQQRWIQFEGGTKTLAIFQEPSDVRNTGLLSIDYDGDKDDDQWLYLPSLRKATRVASSNSADSFLGTDLTFADMTTVDPEAYDYTMVKQSVLVDGVDCWLIEAKPRTEKEKKRTGYVKSQLWIDKVSLIAVQSKAWVADGQKVKYMRVTNYKKLSDIWTALSLTVKVLRNNAVESWTTMDVSDVKYGVASVTDALFNVAQLESAH